MFDSESKKVNATRKVNHNITFLSFETSLANRDDNTKNFSSVIILNFYAILQKKYNFFLIDIHYCINTKIGKTRNLVKTFCSVPIQFLVFLIYNCTSCWKMFYISLI